MNFLLYLITCISLMLGLHILIDAQIHPTQPHVDLINFGGSFLIAFAVSIMTDKN